MEELDSASMQWKAEGITSKEFSYFRTLLPVLMIIRTIKSSYFP